MKYGTLRRRLVRMTDYIDQLFMAMPKNSYSAEIDKTFFIVLSENYNLKN